MAKSPRPGVSKTRLCPPCTPFEAATIADAALRDTLDEALETVASRVVLVLAGPPVSGLPGTIDAIAQRGDSLGERLGNAFADLDEPTLLVGMDTPQIDHRLLDDALERVGRGRAVFGPALDGGWWALGLRQPVPGAFSGVPMSRADTGALQLERLGVLGVRPDMLAHLQDVDHWADAEAVATLRPEGRFAGAVRAVAGSRELSPR